MSVCNDCSIKIEKKYFFGSKYHPLRVDKSASREEKSTLLIFLTCSRDSPHPKTQKKTSRGGPTFQKKNHPLCSFEVGQKWLFNSISILLRHMIDVKKNEQKVIIFESYFAFSQ